MELSAGKHWRMQRLADEHGHLTMLAVDQRPPIEQLVATARRESEARSSDVAAVKRLLVEELAATASAVLVDPLIGYDAARHALDPRRGLLLTLEHAVFEETSGGRLSSPIPGWDVEAIARAGGDAVKALIWYRPDADEPVRQRQLDWAAEVGAECGRLQIPFVLELLLYPMPNRPVPDTADDRADAVIASVGAFADSGIGVDLFKVESPVPPHLLAPPDSTEGRRHQLRFRQLDEVCDRPWVVLSAGAGPEEFARVVEHATTAGASGYLAGRAIWRRALSAFPDLEACRLELRRSAIPFVDALAADVRDRARPWHRDHERLVIPRPIMERP